MRVVDHPLYLTYAGIKQRCFNPSAANYRLYGGRGITMHEPWVKAFWQFVADIEREIGPKPGKKHTLDRIDANGHYEPGNLRWATWEVQNGNRPNMLPALAAPAEKARRSAASKAMWAKKPDEMRAAIKAGKQSPEHRAKVSEKSKAYYADPERRQEAAAFAKAYNTPEVRAEKARLLKTQWADPEFRARMMAARQKGKGD